jgi:hypothetical protein
LRTPTTAQTANRTRLAETIAAISSAQPDVGSHLRCHIGIPGLRRCTVSHGMSSGFCLIFVSFLSGHTGATTAEALRSARTSKIF